MRGHFQLQWSTPDQTARLGVGGDFHHLRWRGIAGDATEAFTARTRALKNVQIRTPDLPERPPRGDAWPAVGPLIREAQAQHLEVLNLNPTLVVRLYAAHKLFGDVCQGDLEADKEMVLDFLRARLQDFWALILRPLIAGPALVAVPAMPVAAPTARGTAQHAERVLAVVRRDRFLSLEDLCQQVAPITRNQVLSALDREPNIRLHHGPEMTIVQWL